MINIIFFDFNCYKVCVFEIDGEFWFIVKDVVEIFGYSNFLEVICYYCKKVQDIGGVLNVYFNDYNDLQEFCIRYGVELNVKFIFEFDVYWLIMCLKLFMVEVFEELVVGKILLIICKMGGYGQVDLNDFNLFCGFFLNYVECIEIVEVKVVEFELKVQVMEWLEVSEGFQFLLVVVKFMLIFQNKFF